MTNEAAHTTIAEAEDMPAEPTMELTPDVSNAGHTPELTDVSNDNDATGEADNEDDLDDFGDASRSQEGGGFTLSASDEPVTAPTTGTILDENVTTQTTHEPAKTGVTSVPPAVTVDPIVKEPYRWPDCTVTISIQLLPEQPGEPRKGYVGIRTHLDAPLVQPISADELQPLPACVEDLIARMKEELPARAEHYLERTRKAAEKNKSKVKETPKRAQLKPGCHTAANLFAQTDAEKQKPAEQQGAAGAGVSDDIFGDMPADEATSATHNGEAREARGKAQTTGSTRSAIKRTRRAKLEANHSPTRTNQGSLLG